MNRRSFLAASAAALASLTVSAAEKKRKSSSSAADAAPSAPPPPTRTTPRPNKKGFMMNTLNGATANKLSTKERFQLLWDAGFAGVEVRSGMPHDEVLAARDATGLQIPSVLVSTHWTNPLSSPNPSARETTVESLKQALRDGKAYGATSVLLVPAVVTKEVSYTDAYKRSVEEIKKCVPLAEELGVAIAIENVWNQFLLSPLEAVQYVDSFKSPMVQWHFDVGNVVNMGFPEQWARILGPRIAKVHVKEFSRKLRDQEGPRAGFNVDLMQGDSDWPAVMAALDEVKYTGWLITEQYRAPGLTDAQYLSQLSQKLDAILVA